MKTKMQKLIKSVGGLAIFMDITGIKQRTCYDYDSGKSDPSSEKVELVRDAIKWRLGAEG